MKLHYEIEINEYWQAGSGLGAGGAYDSTPIKDALGLPYLPGKTLKGVWREAFEMIRVFQPAKLPDEAFYRILGLPAREGNSGQVHFSNATINHKDAEVIMSRSQQQYLYESVASTMVDPSTGAAKEGSLRTAEVCIPLKLEATIEKVNEDDTELFRFAAALIKRLGINRNRGFGRCHVTLK